MKFLLTKELGRLSKWLRILGFDADCSQETRAGSIIISALRDDRVILTRNHRLAKTSKVKTFLVRSEILRPQLQELLKGLNIQLNGDMMFTRCIVCNVELKPIEKQKIKDKVPEYVFDTQDNFMVCPRCEKAYWQGTHWGNVKDTIIGLKGVQWNS